jgi:hypothetical protein
MLWKAENVSVNIIVMCVCVAKLCNVVNEL